MDAHAISNADGVAMLVGLGLAPDDEYQGTRPAFFLKDVHHAELAGYPIAHISRAQELPIAAAVQAVAVEGQRHIKMGFLPGAEVADGWRYVLPSGQRRAEQPLEPAGFSRGFVDV